MKNILLKFKIVKKKKKKATSEGDADLSQPRKQLIQYNLLFSQVCAKSTSADKYLHARQRTFVSGNVLIPGGERKVNSAVKYIPGK